MARPQRGDQHQRKVAMRAHTTWLSEAEKNAIVDEAVELLGRVGMWYAGCGGPASPQGARRPGRRCHRHRPSAPRTGGVGGRPVPGSILMAGLTEDDDVLLDEGEAFHFSPSGCVAKTLDFRTGERRASTLQDVRECTALLDELSELDLMWTQVSASDVPLEQRELTEYFTLLTETRKHITFVDCPTEVDAVVRLCETLAGDLEEPSRPPASRP